MTVGERIRELREDADLKQKEVADALHITNRMMSNYERDICNPSLEYLVAL
ncbi:MAG: helix-turn-helix transcriptional regulator, partial [bacterium]|nr:helix-turn-helix transcriptional regulator [bacterium]MDY4100380.1 helix-turn-helix transcriptional regulator [Lachnospiraceae bacterium]